jgi:tripartite-type tricarboxylate transporter receptor subunit TctC
MKRLCLALALATLAPLAGGAVAQTYPNKPIRVIVPFVAGGAVDMLARMLGAKLSESLGQPVIVENRPGAGGNVAADAVAKSPPDGYTILQNTNGLAISPAIYLRRRARFHSSDATRRLRACAGGKPEVVGRLGPRADRASEEESRQSQLRHDRRRQSAPPDHGDVQTAAGVDIQPVPYKGDAAIFPALITGEIHVAITPMATTLPHVAAGTVRALAVAGAKRSAALPDVPTVAESGLVGFESSSWQGWFVPANTPREIVGVIQQRAKAALSAPDVLERLRITGNEAVASTPDAFEQRFKADLAKFAKIVKEAHIPAQD